jgi:hypothetical protein
MQSAAAGNRIMKLWGSRGGAFFLVIAAQQFALQKEWSSFPYNAYDVLRIAIYYAYRYGQHSISYCGDTGQA